MSQHTIRSLGLALLLALSFLPVPPAGATSGPGPDLGDSIRPRVMKLAADRLGKLAQPATARVALATSSAPPSSSSLRRQVFGYVNAGNFKDPNVGYSTWQWQDLTTVAYFGVHVNADGSLSAADLSAWNSDAGTLVATAHQHGVKAVLSIIQQTQSTLCSSLAAAQTTVTQTIAQLDGADGVNIDYEGVQASCSSNSADTMASRLVNLARLFRQQLPAAQNNLTIATYASAAEFSGGFFDIPGLAPYMDLFFVMAYDLDNSNYQHPPLSCSRYCFNPVGPAYGQPDDPAGYWYNDTRVAETYTHVLGSGAKVILGVPYYGWTACTQGTIGNQAADRPGPNAYPDSGGPAWSNPTYLDATSDVGQTNPWITQPAVGRDPHDTTQNQEPFATWWSPPAPAGSPNATYYHNCWREMYWDDPTALGAKYDVVNLFNLAGAGLFALDYGGGASELWYDISSHFACPTASDLAGNPSGATWQVMPGSAHDVGAAGGCSAAVTGTNPTPGGFGIYHWIGTTWAGYPGGAIRVATGPDGNPWVVSSSGGIYRWTASGWQPLPGSATDIAVGGDGTAWVIGTNPKPGGYGIYWFDGSTWRAAPGGAVRIAAASAQSAWVVNSQGAIYQFENGGWQQMPGSARDVGAGGGAVWVVGNNAAPGGYGIYRWAGSAWAPVQGGAAAISVDQVGLAWVVNSAGTVYERL